MTENIASDIISLLEVMDPATQIKVLSELIFASTKKVDKLIGLHKQQRSVEGRTCYENFYGDNYNKDVGPAISIYSIKDTKKIISNKWMRMGQYHRTDGAAIVEYMTDGSERKYYYILSNRVSEEKYKELFGE